MQEGNDYHGPGAIPPRVPKEKAMQRALSSPILCVLPALLLALPAYAAAAGGDCGKARDPQRCEAFKQAKEACRGSRGAEHRQCLQDQMPPPDCSKMRYPERCEAMVAAKEACKDKNGKDRRRCLKEQMKGVTPPAR
jgi:hypothetical protein